jgi:hypothetical protein
MRLGDQVVAPDGFAGELISMRHGGSTAFEKWTSASDPNINVSAVMAPSGEIRIYRLTALQPAP